MLLAMTSLILSFFPIFILILALFCYFGSTYSFFQQALVDVALDTLPGMLERLVPVVMDLLQGVIDALVSNIGPITELATTILTNLAGLLIDNLLLDAALSIILGLVDGMTQALPELIPAAIAVIGQLAAGLIEAIPQLLEAIPAIFAAIGEGLLAVDWAGLGLKLVTALGNAISSAGAALAGLWDWIGSGLSGLGETITAKGGEIIAWIKAGFDSAVAALTDLWGWITSGFTAEGIGQSLIDAGSNLIGWLQTGIDNALSNILGLWDWIIGSLGDDSTTTEADFNAMGGNIIDWLMAGIKAAITGITSIWSWIFDAFGGLDVDASSLMQSFIDFGASVIGWIRTGIENVIGAIGSVWDWIMGLFGGGSDSEGSTEASDIGADLAQGIASGLEGDGSLTTAIGNVTNTIMTQLAAALGCANGGPSTFTTVYGLSVSQGLGTGMTSEGGVSAVSRPPALLPTSCSHSWTPTWAHRPAPTPLRLPHAAI